MAALSATAGLAAPAHADAGEVSYLDTLYQYSAGPLPDANTLLALGHTTCHTLDQIPDGRGGPGIVWAMVATEGLSPAVARDIIGAATTYLCPAHMGVATQ